MKKLYTLALSVIVFILSIYLTAFIPQKNTTDNYNKIVTDNYHTNYNQLISSVQKLQTSIENLNAKNINQLHQAFTECRMSYKKIEFLIEFLDAEGVKIMINGAPLPGLAKGTDAMEIKQPEGLQTMEELVFAENPLEEKEQLKKLNSKLLTNLEELKKFHTNYRIFNYQVFQAARFQIIRVLSLGLTGFDTPATANAIPEAIVSLGAVYESLKTYFPQLSEKPGQLDKALNQSFTGAIQYLKENNDFDNFDRLYFLKTYLNPLFKNIKNARKALSLPSFKQTQPVGLTLSINPEAENIFGEDLINPYYYTSIRENNHTEEAIKLGELLFFDPVLSNNNQRACASCHNPAKAFTDGEKKSIATDFIGTVERNSPTLINAVYAKRFFYDLRTDNFERQVEHVIYNEKEFNTDVPKILERLGQSEEYVKMFDLAFPSVAGRPSLNPYSFAAAISAYVTSLRSFQSPFDQYVRGEISQIDEDVKKGFNLFMGKAGCATCHFAPTFNGNVPPIFDDSESEVLGVPANKDVNKPVIDEDPGRARARLKERTPIYHRSFKTVTVRNIELTAPYMHNGVYDTLEEVVDFYNRGGGQGMGLDVPNQTLPPDPLDLTDDEQKALIAFMKSLTDAERFNKTPERLPSFPEASGLNKRKIGGEY